MNIAFDLDDVLIDLCGAFIPTINRVMGGEKIIYNEVKEYNLEKCGATKEALNYAARSVYKFWRTETPPYPEADEVLRNIFIQTGRPIRIVTARPNYCAAETLDMCNEYFKHIPLEVIFVNGYGKSIFLKDFDTFVEDRRKTALELADLGKHVYLVDKPYNQCEHKGITRIKDLSEIGI